MTNTETTDLTGEPVTDDEPKSSSKSPMSDARYAATQWLINKYRDEFEEQYAKEAEARGVKTKRMKRDERIKKLKDELRELEQSSL